MAKFTAEQIFDFAIGAGFTPSEAITMTAISLAESGGEMNANNITGEDSQGLWQINMRAHRAKIPEGQDPYDPAVNAYLAYTVYQEAGGSISPWTVTHIAKGAPYARHSAAANAAAEAAGYTNVIGWWGGSNGYGSVQSADSNGASSTAAPSFNGGYSTYGTSDGLPFAGDGSSGGLPEPDDRTSVFREDGEAFIQYELSPGVMISWAVPNGVDVSQYANRGRDGSAQYVSMGDSKELYGIGGDGGFGTITAYVDNVLGILFPGDNPATTDAGVMNVIAQYLARPDMQPEELQGLLQNTDYFQGLTDKAQGWNDFTLAERQAQITNETQWLINEDQSLSGKDTDLNDPFMRKLAKDIAMGVLTRGEGRELLENKAEEDPESPWSRTLRNEGINRKQFGVDIENTTETLKEQARSWGLRISDGTLADWSEKINLNDQSAGDYLNYLKSSATALYPDKPPDMMTQTWAEPFTQASARLMEKAPDLFDADVQNALATGQTIRDFETSLKGNDAWLETKNAGQELGGMAARMSRDMGFS